jgi:aminoglycoside phosphotransferase (APT) family kinase protein
MSRPVVPAPRPLASVLSEVPGRWVAVDRVTGEPVAAADTPYELARELRSRRIKNVAIVRAPDPREPELVGLG